MKQLIAAYFFLLATGALGQTITPQVINTAGDHKSIGGTGLTITDNVGEPFVQTVYAGNIMVTQGFLQPDIIAKTGPVISVLKNDVSCSDKKDGNITIAITNTTSNFQVSYYWSPDSLCPNHNCNSLDSLIAGTYSVQVVITDTIANTTETLTPQPIVIKDENGPCLVKIYNAVTMNFDGVNDFFVIDNISEFPDNRVTIYNRWGAKMFDEKGYDNNKVRWPSADKNQNISPSTYFYIITLGNGTPALKGWVEVINN